MGTFESTEYPECLQHKRYTGTHIDLHSFRRECRLENRRCLCRSVQVLLTAMAATPRDQDLALEAALAETIIVGEARRRALGARTVSDRASGITTGLSLAIALLTWRIVAPPPNVALPLVFICIAAHAAASLVEFEIGPGSALPTTPVLILSAFLLPPQALPIVAIGGLGLSALVAGMKDPRRHERAAVVVGSAWHAMGLAAIFALTGMHKASLSQWPLWVAALSAQFIADAASSWMFQSI